MTERPAVLSGFTQVVSTVCGNMYITINSDETGKLVEFFATLGKAGTCGKSYSEMIGRLITIAARKDTDIKKIIRTLKGNRCGSATDENVSCGDAFSKALETFLASKKI
jgi:ribonucleoside-diphosphate reductase alpha chain